MAETSESPLANLPGPMERPPLMTSFSKENDGQDVYFVQVHEGLGKLGVKLFMFSGASHPAYLSIYDMPPGASEGVHVHTASNENGMGVFDEYYYIISGVGEMEIDGQIVPVKAGDHVHTPLGVSHGIKNTSDSENLKVYLTFIVR